MPSTWHFLGMVIMSNSFNLCTYFSSKLVHIICSALCQSRTQIGMWISVDHVCFQELSESLLVMNKKVPQSHVQTHYQCIFGSQPQQCAMASCTLLLRTKSRQFRHPIRSPFTLFNKNLIGKSSRYRFLFLEQSSFKNDPQATCGTLRTFIQTVKCFCHCYLPCL